MSPGQEDEWTKDEQQKVEEPFVSIAGGLSFLEMIFMNSWSWSYNLISRLQAALCFLGSTSKKSSSCSRLWVKSLPKALMYGLFSKRFCCPGNQSEECLDDCQPPETCQAHRYSRHGALETATRTRTRKPCRPRSCRLAPCCLGC